MQLGQKVNLCFRLPHRPYVDPKVLLAISKKKLSLDYQQPYLVPRFGKKIPYIPCLGEQCNQKQRYFFGDPFRGGGV